MPLASACSLAALQVNAHVRDSLTKDAETPTIADIVKPIILHLYQDGCSVVSTLLRDSRALPRTAPSYRERDRLSTPDRCGRSQADETGSDPSDEPCPQTSRACEEKRTTASARLTGAPGINEEFARGHELLCSQQEPGETPAPKNALHEFPHGLGAHEETGALPESSGAAHAQVLEASHCAPPSATSFGSTTGPPRRYARADSDEPISSPSVETGRKLPDREFDREAHRQSAEMPSGCESINVERTLADKENADSLSGNSNTAGMASERLTSAATVVSPEELAGNGKLKERGASGGEASTHRHSNWGAANGSADATGLAEAEKAGVRADRTVSEETKTGLEALPLFAEDPETVHPQLREVILSVTAALEIQQLYPPRKKSSCHEASRGEASRCRERAQGPERRTAHTEDTGKEHSKDKCTCSPGTEERRSELARCDGDATGVKSAKAGEHVAKRRKVDRQAEEGCVSETRGQSFAANRDGDKHARSAHCYTRKRNEAAVGSPHASQLDDDPCEETLVLDRRKTAGQATGANADATPPTPAPAYDAGTSNTTAGDSSQTLEHAPLENSSKELEDVFFFQTPPPVDASKTASDECRLRQSDPCENNETTSSSWDDFCCCGEGTKDEADEAVWIARGILPYDVLYGRWKGFLMKVAPTGLGLASYFGRSFIFHVLHECLPSLLEELSYTVAGATPADLRRFVLALAEAVGLSRRHASDLFQEALSSRASRLESILPSETGLGFLHRDAGGAREEELGIISFCCITNDRQPLHMAQLVTAKNIFSRQLPKMPREYIVRLVFDRHHFTYCLLKQGRVIGGVCFRPYAEKRFAEIAFLAISSSEQVKGYGTRLMNHLKEHVKRSGIEYFLTYADNFAVGYFRKQGFTSKISMSRDRWMGYIKDYDGGTLMECKINPKINYLQLSQLLARQKIAVKGCVEKHSSSLVWPPITFWKENPGQLLPPSEIPGLAQLDTKNELRHFLSNNGSGIGFGFPGTAARTGLGRPFGLSRDGLKFEGATGAGGSGMSLKSQISALLSLLEKHSSSWPFRRPVSAAEAPDYYEVIARPMDISTLKKKNRLGVYRTKAAFREDLLLMFDNCRLYNSPETIYYKYADELQGFIWPKLDLLTDL